MTEYDLVAHLRRQMAWSEKTFGPGDRTVGVVDHIRKELKEILEYPKDLSEWIDVAILAFDGAWRNGFTAEQIAAALEAKQGKNERREWPDWRTAPKDKAIEHIRQECCRGGECRTVTQKVNADYCSRCRRLLEGRDQK